MSTISVSLPSDGQTIDAADYNTPINTIVNEINGNLDNSNLSASAAIAGSKIASGGIGTTQIADDSVTPDKWTNPYCFRAVPSGATTLTDNTAVKVAFATEEYDYNNNFASSTYTAPVAGVYHFMSVVGITGSVATGVDSYIMLYKNGSLIARGTRSVPANNETHIIVTDLLLAANDTIEVYFFQDSAGGEATNGSATTEHFSGHLVRAT